MIPTRNEHHQLHNKYKSVCCCLVASLLKDPAGGELYLYVLNAADRYMELCSLIRDTEEREETGEIHKHKRLLDVFERARSQKQRFDSRWDLKN